MVIMIDLYTEAKYCFKKFNTQQKSLHNNYGPSWDSVFYNHSREYYIDGKLHNELGPAKITGDGINIYYLNGIHYTHKNWKKEIEKKMRDID